ncbi:hypothetical protein [Pelagerythrobacter rhizovicinus]|uniref:PRC-barrel domain-containing protein n=1 Tax=Pelagerythrobacter rhizovicinus TaxID=2268576 RepID=A0A4V1QWF4_9SPHN|nr:hypothetical protein [Pelagerythrobacter rhizovicinus]RXZ65966.1 hypothetical protein ETX26_04390 [Pelagerythrobacter rhizovicinus]
MKFSKMAITAIAAAGIATAAYAQGVTAGATVYGPEGNAVGTIESVADGVVTVDTGKHKAPLPANAFGEGEQGPTITVTKAQLNAMLDEQVAAANAKRDAALIETATVVTADNQPLGIVESIEGDNVIVARSEGDVNLLREHFAVNQNGQLMALFTAAQIDEAVAAQTAAAGGSDSSAGASQ